MKKKKSINTFNQPLNDNEFRISLQDLNTDKNKLNKIVAKHIADSTCEDDWGIVVLDSLEKSKESFFLKKMCLLTIYFEAILIQKMNLDKIIQEYNLTDETEYGNEPKFGESVIFIYSNKDQQ